MIEELFWRLLKFAVRRWLSYRGYQWDAATVMIKPPFRDHIPVAHITPCDPR